MFWEDGVAMDLGIAGLEDVVEVGRGGFATVYRAYQPAFRRTVAVKVLNAADVDDVAAERFRRECQAMGLLSEHPSIVTILDAGFLDSGQPFMVMPFMPAGSLGDRVRRDGPLPWAEASKVAVKLAGALHAAHDAGVIHRDVKPANVLVSEYGETKLADFGIARVSGASETQSGVVTASLAYAPPEIVEGKRPTVKSDIYSLGATVYDLVAGHAPFRVGGETSVAALLQKILNDDPPDLTGRGVPEPIGAVITEAMAKDPDRRFATAALFGRRMRLAQDELGIRPTELMIAKIEPQVPAAKTDAEPEAPTAAGTQIDDEPETVGVTAQGSMTVSVVPDDTDGLDSEATRDVPVVAESRSVGDSASVPTTDEGTERPWLKRPKLIAATAAVAAAIVVASIALSGGSGDEGESTASDSNDAAEPAATDDDATSGDVPSFDPARETVELGAMVNDSTIPPPARGNDTPFASANCQNLLGAEENLIFDCVGRLFAEDARAILCPEGLVDVPDEVGDLAGARFDGVTLRCTDFSGRDLAGTQFTNSDVSGSDFSNVTMQGGSIWNTVGVAIIVDGADFTGGDFSDSELYLVDFSEATLTDVFMSSTSYIGSTFVNVDLTATREATSTDPGLPFFGDSTDVRRANFSGLRMAGLPNSDARGTDFSNTTWDAAQAHNAQDSIFDGASLAGAQAPRIEFTNTSFRDVDFRGGDFSGANFDNADLTGALVEGADFTEARFLDATCPNGQPASGFGLCDDITGG